MIQREWKVISTQSIRESLKNMGDQSMLCGVPVKRLSGNTYEIDGETLYFLLEEAVEYLYDIQPID